MKHLSTLAAALLLATGASAQLATVQSANTPTLLPYSDQEGPDYSTFGWRFTLGPASLTVTQLGLFDGGSDGLLAAHEVGIWDNTGSLLTSATVQAGAASSLSGGYRYEAVTPVTLDANQTYQIGALFQENNNDGLLSRSSQTFTSYLAFDEAAISQPGIGVGALTNPTLTFNYDQDQGFFGPNFTFTPTPEPGTVLGVSALALGAVGWVRQGKRMTASR